MSPSPSRLRVHVCVGARDNLEHPSSGAAHLFFEIQSLTSLELTKQARWTIIQVIEIHQSQHWDYFSNYNYSISPFPFLPPNLPISALSQVRLSFLVNCYCTHICIYIFLNVTCSVCMLLLSMFLGFTTWYQTTNWFALGIIKHTTKPDFFKNMGTGLNSDHHVYKTSTLLTQLSCKPGDSQGEKPPKCPSNDKQHAEYSYSKILIRNLKKYRYIQQHG